MRTILTALVLVGLGASVSGQGLKPKEILEKFGDGTVLTDDQFRTFVAAELISTFDGESDWPKDTKPTVRQEEFVAAWLHILDTWPAQPVPIDQFTAPAGEAAFQDLVKKVGYLPLDANTLPKHPPFKVILDVRAGKHRGWASPGRLDHAALETYIKTRRAHRAKRTSLSNRLKWLSDEAGDKQVSHGEYSRFAAKVRLHRADADGSGTLDPWEFRSAFSATVTQHQRHERWLELAKLEKSLVLPVTVKPHGAIVELGHTDADAEWDAQAREDDELIPLDDLLKRQQEAHEKETKSPTRIFSEGYLLYPKPGVDEKKNAYTPDSGHRFFVKIRRDVRVPDSSAQPAVFNWKKEDGDETLTVDGAIGLSWKFSGFSMDNELLFSTRWNRTREKTKEVGDTERRTDTREYYAGWAITTESHYWRLGAVREEDQRMDVTRNALVLDWYPTFGERWWRTGDWNNIFFEEDLEWSYEPSLSVELGRYEDNRPGVTELPSQSRAELNVGLRLFEKLTLQSRVGLLTDLEEWDRSFLFHESSLSYPILGKDNITLAVSAKTGRDAPTFMDVERYEVGIGVKF